MRRCHKPGGSIIQPGMKAGPLEEQGMTTSHPAGRGAALVKVIYGIDDIADIHDPVVVNIAV